MSRVLNLLLTHQQTAEIDRMLDWWGECCDLDDVLIAFNGSAQTFAEIRHPHKVRIEDTRLATTDHQRDRQSYTGVIRAAAQWLAGRDYTHVHFAEYDHLPLVPDLNARQVSRLETERADILAFKLLRIDGTNHPHYLYHANLPGFAAFWQSTSSRANQSVVLSMFGSGSFWTYEAFVTVAGRAEPFPIYLELYLPTLAHHLGFRLRDWQEQNRYVRNLGNLVDEIEPARAAGAWTIHPIKGLWSAPNEVSQVVAGDGRAVSSS